MIFSSNKWDQRKIDIYGEHKIQSARYWGWEPSSQHTALIVMEANISTNIELKRLGDDVKNASTSILIIKK